MTTDFLCKMASDLSTFLLEKEKSIQRLQKENDRLRKENNELKKSLKDQGRAFWSWIFW